MLPQNPATPQTEYTQSSAWPTSSAKKQKTKKKRPKLPIQLKFFGDPTSVSYALPTHHFSRRRGRRMLDVSDLDIGPIKRPVDPMITTKRVRGAVLNPRPPKPRKFDVGDLNISYDLGLPMQISRSFSGQERTTTTTGRFTSAYDEITGRTLRHPEYDPFPLQEVESSTEVESLSWKAHIQITFILICAAFKLVFCYFLLNTKNMHQFNTRLLFFLDLLCYYGVYQFVKLQFWLTRAKQAFMFFYFIIIGLQIGFHLAMSVYVFQESHDVKDPTMKNRIRLAFVIYTILLALYMIVSIPVTAIDTKLIKRKLNL